MPAYHRLGEIPPKRHTQFRRTDGALYSEEVFGTEGFSGNYSILYHYNLPTRVKTIERFTNEQFKYAIWDEQVHRHHHMKTAVLPRGGDAVLGRQVLMFNQDVIIGISKWNFKVFVVSFKRGDEGYEAGRRKYQKRASSWWKLYGQ